MSVAKKGLGRGLGALLESSNGSANSSFSPGVVEIDITKIEPNKNQPRKHFEEESLNALCDSIKEFGIIQPILVKKENDYYCIIAGERRFRAARLAKLAKIPVIIKEYTDIEALQIALIENIQRKDLNPIEEALCFKSLVNDYFFRHEDIAIKVGRSRGSISNSLSLLSLDTCVQNFIIQNKLTSAHGRALLPLKNSDDMNHIAETIIESSLSVRESEKLVKSFINSKLPKNDTIITPLAPKYTYLENDLKSLLGTKVTIKSSKDNKQGKIEINYYSQEDLDRLFVTLKQIKLN
jgi:ParB family transcriptional regulator, chromosome partitioning protein